MATVGQKANSIRSNSKSINIAYLLKSSAKSIRLSDSSNNNHCSICTPSEPNIVAMYKKNPTVNGRQHTAKMASLVQTQWSTIMTLGLAMSMLLVLTTSQVDATAIAAPTAGSTINQSSAVQGIGETPNSPIGKLRGSLKSKTFAVLYNAGSGDRRSQGH